MSNLEVTYEIVDIKTCGTNLFDLEEDWHDNILGPLSQGSEIYSRESRVEDEPKCVVNPATDEVEKLSETRSLSALGLSCQKCSIATFNNFEDQREHYRSEYHRINIQRRLKQLAPLTTAEFEQLVGKLSGLSEDEGDCELEALFSQLEADSSEEEPEGANLSKGQIRLTASPILWLQLKAPELSLFGIYRSLTACVGDEWQRLKGELSVHRKSTWGLIMLGGGHFVGVVFDNSRFDSKNNKPYVVVSKTFHRYTVRRKQGGSQVGNDNNKSKARSAGANIRRQMETMLREDIHALLAAWSHLLENCSQLYVRAPGANYKLLYPNAAFTPHDKRIFRFPFTTRRPTLKEAQRCYLELIHPKTANLEMRPIALWPKPKIKPGTPTTRAQPTPQKPRPRRIPSPHGKQPDHVHAYANSEPEPLTLDLVDSLVTWIQNNHPNGESKSLPEVVTKVLGSKFIQSTPNYRIKGLPNQPTLLHLACQYNQPQLVAPLLALGCSPTLPLAEGSNPKTAYQLAKSKSAKLQFRVYRFHHPNQYDWELAKVPPPISPELHKLPSQSAKKKVRIKRETPQPASSSVLTNSDDPPKPDPSPPIFAVLAMPKPRPDRPLGLGFGSVSRSVSSKLGFGFTTALTGPKTLHQ